MKTLLITGGTGSFGSTFTEYLLRHEAIDHIRIFSRDEHKQRQMRMRINSDKVSYFIGDIRDKERLKRVMDGCSHVIHAAALKQAPLGEIEAQEFIKTNVLGSSNVIEAAMDCSVLKCLLISTDKAVEPINLYGATKMCAEKMFLQANKLRGQSITSFAFTRYGNVAGTSGSIIPMLKSLKDDEPSMVYDEEATRFWITLEQAHEFVFNSLMEMEGGEVFIPKMKSVRIMDVVMAIRPWNKVWFAEPRDGDKRHEIISLEPRISSDQNDFLSVDEIREYAYPRETVNT